MAKYRSGDRDTHFNVFVAIDFGTTFSGYAFAIGQTSEHINVQGDDGSGGHKIPTAVLLDKHGKLLSFGKKALETYFLLETDKEIRNHFFFDRFKMTLRKDEDVTGTNQIEAANGKTMDAKTVFARSLQYFYQTIKREIPLSTGANWVEKEVKWILTVPAIWGDRAKRFMLDAAEEAGMMSDSGDNIEIALEPEAAALSCRTDLQGVCKALQRSDSLRYIVVDCGGGTVDVTVNELDLVSRKIKEVHTATGGAWGGTEVDKNVKAVLEKAIGTDLMRKVNSDAWLRFSRQNIEEGKKLPEEGGKATIHATNELLSAIAAAGGSLGKDLKVPGITFRSRASAFSLQYEVMAGCYDEPINNTVRHVRDLKEEVGNIHCILVVGGFAECPLLIQRMEMEFRSDKFKVIRPKSPSLAVVKGAVMYGQNPDIIEARVSKYSYGIDTSVPFEPSVHPQRLRYTEGGKEFCRRVFAHFVRAGDSMSIGSAFKQTISPTSANQKGMRLQLYRSPKKDVKFTDEPDCERLVMLRVEMPRTHEGAGRVVDVSLDVSRTTLQLTGVDRSSGQRGDVKYNDFD